MGRQQGGGSSRGREEGGRGSELASRQAVAVDHSIVVCNTEAAAASGDGLAVARRDGAADVAEAGGDQMQMHSNEATAVPAAARAAALPRHAGHCLQEQVQAQEHSVGAVCVALAHFRGRAQLADLLRSALTRALVRGLAGCCIDEGGVPGLLCGGRKRSLLSIGYGIIFTATEQALCIGC